MDSLKEESSKDQKSCGDGLNVDSGEQQLNNTHQEMMKKMKSLREEKTRIKNQISHLTDEMEILRNKISTTSNIDRNIVTTTNIYPGQPMEAHKYYEYPNDIFICRWMNDSCEDVLFIIQGDETPVWDGFSRSTEMGPLDAPGPLRSGHFSLSIGLNAFGEVVEAKILINITGLRILDMEK